MMEKVMKRWRHCLVTFSCIMPSGCSDESMLNETQCNVTACSLQWCCIFFAVALHMFCSNAAYALQ